MMERLGDIFRGTVKNQQPPCLHNMCLQFKLILLSTAPFPVFQSTPWGSSRPHLLEPREGSLSSFQFPRSNPWASRSAATSQRASSAMSLASRPTPSPASWSLSSQSTLRSICQPSRYLLKTFAKWYTCTYTYEVPHYEIAQEYFINTAYFMYCSLAPGLSLQLQLHNNFVTIM